jgi:hypothetical protein
MGNANYTFSTRTLWHRRQTIRLVGLDHGRLSEEAGEEFERYVRRALPGSVQGSVRSDAFEV